MISQSDYAASQGIDSSEENDYGVDNTEKIWLTGEGSSRERTLEMEGESVGLTLELRQQTGHPLPYAEAQTTNKTNFDLLFIRFCSGSRYKPPHID